MPKLPKLVILFLNNLDKTKLKFNIVILSVISRNMKTLNNRKSSASLQVNRHIL